MIAYFDRHAPHYDAWNHIQNRVADQLETMLPETVTGPIVELGCGTGAWTARLRRRYRETPILASDPAEAMVIQAKTRSLENVTWTTLSAGQSPLPPQTTLITANASLHWLFLDPGKVALINNLLPAGSQLMASFFGPQTFPELKLVLAETLGRSVRLPSDDFLSAVQLAASWPNRTVSLTQWQCRWQYASVLELFRSIHYTGTRGKGPRYLQGPGHLQKMERLWRQYWGAIWCHYEVFFLCVTA